MSAISHVQLGGWLLVSINVASIAVSRKFAYSNAAAPARVAVSTKAASSVVSWLDTSLQAATPAHMRAHKAEELAALRTQHQQLQPAAAEATGLRVQIGKMQEIVASLPELCEQMSRMQIAHDDAIDLSKQHGEAAEGSKMQPEYAYMMGQPRDLESSSLGAVDAAAAASSVTAPLLGRSSCQLLLAISSCTSADALSRPSAGDDSTQVAGDLSGKPASVDGGSEIHPTDLASAAAGVATRHSDNRDSRLYRQQSSEAMLRGRLPGQLAATTVVASTDQKSDSEDTADSVAQVMFPHAAITEGVSLADVSAAIARGAAESYIAAPQEASTHIRDSKAEMCSLVLLLSMATDGDTLLSALSELQDLAHNEPAVSLGIVQNAGTVQRLSDLLDESSERLRIGALQLVKTLADAGPEPQAALGHCASLIRRLLESLHCADREIKNWAAVVLWALVKDNPQVQGQVGLEGGVGLVLDLCAMMKHPNTASFAAALTWILVADHVDNQNLFLGLGPAPSHYRGYVMQWLLRMLEYGDSGEQKYAEGALNALVTGNARVLAEARYFGLQDQVHGILQRKWYE